MQEGQNKNSFESDKNERDEELSSYKDCYIDLSSEALKIHYYFFPFLQTKTIPISKIKNINLIDLNLLNGKLRVFGLDFKCIYYHFDIKRPIKKQAITLKEEGNWLTIGITPEDPQKCFKSLKFLLENNRKNPPESKGIEEEDSLIKGKEKIN